jgi:hypothetical protein
MRVRSGLHRRRCSHHLPRTNRLLSMPQTQGSTFASLHQNGFIHKDADIVANGKLTGTASPQRQLPSKPLSSRSQPLPIPRTETMAITDHDRIRCGLDPVLLKPNYSGQRYKAIFAAATASHSPLRHL